MRNSKPVLFHIFIGIVIGWITSLLSFIYIGGSDALWALAIFGCMCMFLGCIHYYTKANNISQSKPSGSKENKSLLSKTKSRIWED